MLHKLPFLPCLRAHVFRLYRVYGKKNIKLESVSVKASSLDPRWLIHTSSSSYTRWYTLAYFDKFSHSIHTVPYPYFFFLLDALHHSPQLDIFTALLCAKCHVVWNVEGCVSNILSFPPWQLCLPVWHRPGNLCLERSQCFTQWLHKSQVGNTH